MVPQESAYASVLACKGQTRRNRTVPNKTEPTCPCQHPRLIKTQEESSCRDVIFDDIRMPNSKIRMIGGLMRHFVIPCNKKQRQSSSDLITTSVIRHFTVIDWSVCRTRCQKSLPMKAASLSLSEWQRPLLQPGFPWQTSKAWSAQAPEPAEGIFPGAS